MRWVVGCGCGGLVGLFVLFVCSSRFGSTWRPPSAWSRRSAAFRSRCEPKGLRAREARHVAEASRAHGRRLERSTLTYVDVDVVALVGGDDEVDLDVRHVDAETLFVSMATTPSRAPAPGFVARGATTFRSFTTSSEAAHSIASPRAISSRCSRCSRRPRRPAPAPSAMLRRTNSVARTSGVGALGMPLGRSQRCGKQAREISIARR